MEVFMITLNGIDRIEAYDQVFRGKRLGLITSSSGINRSFRSSIDLLREAYELVSLFSPEHGIRGSAAAGDEVADSIDPYSGLTVHSLYQKNRTGIPDELLAPLDAVVYDIQDVGCRYYTYISTLISALRDCARADRELIVLDRVNPLGGKAEGNILSREWISFIGAWPLCMRYGLTAGELADMVNEAEQLHCRLTIVPVSGWQRTQLFPETGLSWMMPSPNMPTFETALLYPGTCLFEGTTLSEGRGTTVPFQMVGAPGIDGFLLAQEMNQKELPGVGFTPAFFTPTFSKHAGIPCEGVLIHVTDPHLAEPVRTAVELLFLMRNRYPEQAQFLESTDTVMGINRLAGADWYHTPPRSAADVLAQCHEDEKQFAAMAKDYFRY